MTKTYLLTGGTGFLGSFLAKELIQKNNKIIFLGRAKNGVSFAQRIKNLTKQKGDVIETDLQNDIDFSGKIDAIWHLAADLSFKEKDKDKVFQTNIQGLKHILNLAEKLECPLYYTSTAYIHGKRCGRVFENELIRPKKFNNYYEESKFEAEKLIHKWAKRGNKYIIFRPSILIDRESRIKKFFGYYAILYALYKLKRGLGKKKMPFLFPYSKNSSLNLMPVNTTVDWMIKIVQESEALNKTFHITNPNPLSIKEMAKQTFPTGNLKPRLIKIPRFLVSSYLSLICFLGLLVPILRTAIKNFSYYKYYMLGCNTYDMTNIRNILGENEIKNLRFETNFIKDVISNFTKKIDKKNESIHN